MPSHWTSLVELYLDENERVNDLMEYGPATLIHGDSHLGNLFVDRGEIGWLDWACFSRAPGMRDVAYFLTNSLDTGFRREHEASLLDGYRRSLAKAGGPERSRDEIFADYRRFAAYSFVAAVTTAAAGARMQSVDVGRRAMQRTSDAVSDLETLAILRESI